LISAILSFEWSQRKVSLQARTSGSIDGNSIQIGSQSYAVLCLYVLNLRTTTVCRETLWRCGNVEMWRCGDVEKIWNHVKRGSEDDRQTCTSLEDCSYWQSRDQHLGTSEFAGKNFSLCSRTSEGSSLLWTPAPLFFNLPPVGRHDREYDQPRHAFGER